MNAPEEKPPTPGQDSNLKTYLVTGSVALKSLLASIALCVIGGIVLYKGKKGLAGAMCLVAVLFASIAASGIMRAIGALRAVFPFLS